MWKQKQNKTKIRVLGNGLCIQEQPYVCIIKSVCVGKIMCMQFLAKKP